jgi:hypothetical protein
MTYRPVPNDQVKRADISCFNCRNVFSRMSWTQHARTIDQHTCSRAPIISCMICQEQFPHSHFGGHWIRCNKENKDKDPSEKKLRRYLASKKSGSKRRGIPFYLTLDDIRQLLNEAGITIWDVGTHSGQFVLARYGPDIGPYERGNCRFIRTEENSLEWWDSLTLEEKEEHRDIGRTHTRKR